MVDDPFDGGSKHQSCVVNVPVGAVGQYEVDALPPGSLFSVFLPHPFSPLRDSPHKPKLGFFAQHVILSARTLLPRSLVAKNCPAAAAQPRTESSPLSCFLSSSFFHHGNSPSAFWVDVVAPEKTPALADTEEALTKRQAAGRGSWRWQRH